jgi:two-component system OmpR family sensor kinase
MKATANRSLQWRLSLWLFATIVATGVVAGAVSFAWALHDASEILDGNLVDAAGLIAGGQMALPDRPTRLPGVEAENDVMVIPLRAGAGPHAPEAGLDALTDGLHTLEWQGDQWRFLVRSMGPGERVAVAQRMEVRDEIARNGAVRSVLPLAILVPLLILLVREIVRRTLRSLSDLARHIDSNAIGPAARLPDADVPSEIDPFILSIRRLLAQLSEALEQQQRFVANAAHELRSPMAALQLQAANMERVVESEEGKRRLAQLELGIARMQHLLEQLLSMARTQVTGDELVPVRLVDVAKDVLGELASSASSLGVDLGMAPSDPSLFVAATPFHLETLLRNAVENAIKYSPSGSAVTVSVFKDGVNAVLAVDDEGPGIAEADRLRVFEPFFRAAGSTVPGSGLGLAIVAAVAQHLGGRAELRGRAPLRGTRFEYRQPIVWPASDKRLVA